MGDEQAKQQRDQRMMPEIDYNQLGAAIAERLAKSPPPEKIIWDSEDCAHYLKCSRKHFTDRISKMPSFPEPVKHLSCRWLMTDVVKWASSH
jgi:hypothetical protein